MNSITQILWNSNTQDFTTQAVLDETGTLYISEDDVCIELDKEEIDKLLQLLLNKK